MLPIFNRNQHHIPLSTYSFPNSQRLKSRKLIKQLFEEGHSIFEKPVRAVWLIHPEPIQESLQIGFAVSKKTFPKAVSRNRMKRLMREAWRLEQHRIKPFLDNHGLHVAVMLMFTGRELESLNTLQPKIIVILDRLQDALAEYTKEL